MGTDDHVRQYNAENSRYFSPHIRLHNPGGSGLAQGMLRVSSGLAQGWLKVGSRLAHGWLTVGSRLAHGWLRGMLRVSSGLAQGMLRVSSGSAQGWLKVGSRLAHGWLTVGSRLAHGWLTVGSGSINDHASINKELWHCHRVPAAQKSRSKNGKR
ncbi:hypothetical protein PCH_Pc20g00020 [Penicillium rubens Wisconsin 54-1255]|uniref:Uncharacterized protein n=1 Tax=Penicillium rubens (strain ATCC 28089 / DSM 1075 / NRRL 1951 / Wisconsin 54-1255) TaxID=500485 RepID=B6HER1_PENRW|nr:hypothetical protein PCH_Pc20g00020 [Penicillium rubens Wisconsin 54-1255]